MENFAKILKILLAGIALGIIGFFVSKSLKKEVKKQDDQENKEKEDLAEVGISKVRYDKEMVPGIDDGNITKAVYLSVDSDWDVDIINAQKCIDNQNVIHVGHTDTEFNVFFEIPKKKKGNYNHPTIKDFIRVLKGEKYKLIERLSKDHVFKFIIFSGLEGHIMVSFKNSEGHTVHGTMLIVEKLYESYADENHDGLVNFINNFRTMSQEEMVNAIYESDSYCLDNITDLEILDVKLLYKYSFNKQFITVKIAKDILEYLIDNVVVARIGDDEEFNGIRYDYVMFNTFGPAGNWSLLHFYEGFRNEETKAYEVVVNKYVYKYLDGVNVEDLDQEDLKKKLRIKRKFN